jgi:menaquinol-cytochrome c reductase iron-sulfur subunit
MNEPQPVTRRTALGILGTSLAAAWTLAIAGLSAAFASAPLRAPTRRREAALGTLDTFSEKFRVVDLRIATSDGWYSKEEVTRVYARLDDTGAPFVLSATCTHLGCTVQWEAGKNEFRCPCHGGRYSIDGAVLSGPPPRPLERLNAQVRDGNVVVELG